MRHFIFCGILLLGACVSGGPTPPPIDPDSELQNVQLETYTIGVRDVLSIHVWDNPDLSLQIPVRPDGFISMPLVGDVVASGLEAEALAARITEELSGQLRNPVVTVIVTSFNSAEYITRVRITGAVGSPRSLEYDRGMTVLDAILEAGGVRPTAAANRTKLYRQEDGKLIELEIRIDDILLRGRLETNYFLRPGDMITVPERLF